MEAGPNRFNKFGIGIVLIAIASVGIIWFTNPELITSWFRKTPMEGEVVWQHSPKTGVLIWNKSDLEWKNVRVILNKNSVSQRYEFSAGSIVRHPQGFFIPVERFKKTSNAEQYDVNAGEPHLITVEATLPDEKPGSLEVKLGGKKI